MTPQQIAEIERRWDGVSKGTTRLTFDEASADMRSLIAEARKAEALRLQVAALESHVLKRNADLQAFAAEVMQLAHRKYADYRASPT